ncbi:hypothetical protein H4S04_006882 [Coemansia sp. S16]|nr:hypothetical protein H4S04_006882 [Coemansia sp. S16]
MPVTPRAARPTIASASRAAACAAARTTTHAKAPQHQPVTSAVAGKLTIPVTPCAARPTIASASRAAATVRPTIQATTKGADNLASVPSSKPLEFAERALPM